MPSTSSGNKCSSVIVSVIPSTCGHGQIPIFIAKQAYPRAMFSQTLPIFGNCLPGIRKFWKSTSCCLAQWTQSRPTSSSTDPTCNSCAPAHRSEEHTTELQTLMLTSYAVSYFTNKNVTHKKQI